MIIDKLKGSSQLVAAFPRFAPAFEFLSRPDAASLQPGRYEIGNGFFALVATDAGRGRSAARLEAHRKYIDIQYVTLGHELIGWERIEECAGKGLGYDADNDIEFYGNPPSLWLPVPAGVFAVFFPEDAHAPLAGETPVRKIVVKAPVAGYPS